MKKEIIINATMNEVRIAITEDGKLAELFIELPDKERSIGNIYLGRVTRIIQGLNAAFINIGQKQDGFLHFSDIDESLENIYSEEDDEAQGNKNPNKQLPEPKDSDEDIPNEHYDVALRKSSPPPKKNGRGRNKYATFRTQKLGNLQINLEPRQNVIVQIVREAYSTKGVKITTKIGIPGRYVVLMPFESSIGISRKISSWHERKRLRSLAKSALPKGFGCIIRTAAMNKTETELLKDWESLVNIWNGIDAKVKEADGPTLLYQDMDIAISVIRDLFTPDVRRVVIDSKRLYNDIYQYIEWSSPQLLSKIKWHKEKTPIFEKFGIEDELETTHQRKVNLPSGGSIVIDQTEAMFIVDVNSGRSTSESQQEKIALYTNLEAVREIARQTRLRDMAGMILIDMIDVNHESNKKKIFTEMKTELGRDRAKTMVYPLTQLCILQITRQRINQNINEKISEECPLCLGSGRITSKGIIANGIERWLKNFRASSREFRLTLVVHPHIAVFLTEGTLSRMSKLMIKYFVKVKVQQNNQIQFGDFKFLSDRHNKDITQEYQ
ncbi:MAG: Rne/Rng family ribonuclease [Chlorobi bacterium]|nr:Rne/Rng family ribonuclease [Chlorobiota bacterium]